MFDFQKQILRFEIHTSSWKSLNVKHKARKSKLKFIYTNFQKSNTNYSTSNTISIHLLLVLCNRALLYIKICIDNLVISVRELRDYRSPH